MPAILPLVAAAVTTAAGVNSIAQSRKTQSSASSGEMQQVADPFASLRPFFQSMLLNQAGSLTSLNPSDIENDPSFAFEKDQGLHAIDAAASASGLLRSGTREMERAKFATGLAATYDQQRFSRQMSVLQAIMSMAGVSAGNPGAAISGMLGQEQLANSQQNNGINAITGGLGMLRQWFQMPGASTPISNLPTGLDSGGGPAYG